MYIDEIVVENPHDPVAEFVENYLSKKNTPNNSQHRPSSSTSSSTNRYARPKTSEEVQLARLSSIPEATRRDTNWCVKVWRDWSESRNMAVATENSPNDPATLAQNPAQLSFWLERFVLEII